MYLLHKNIGAILLTTNINNVNLKQKGTEHDVSVNVKRWWVTNGCHCFYFTEDERG